MEAVRAALLFQTQVGLSMSRGHPKSLLCSAVLNTSLTESYTS